MGNSSSEQWRRQLWDWSNIVFSFVEIKAIYEMLVARSLSKGTVHEVLKRMLRKGLVIRRPEGYTFNPKITIHEALIEGS
ncbi:MAG: helix-turn-helix domain-containing protein [Ignisphaera sp.]